MLQSQSGTKAEASVGMRGRPSWTIKWASLPRPQAASPLTGFGEGALGRIIPALWGGPACLTVSASRAPENRQEWGGGKQLLLEQEGSLGTAVGRKQLWLTLPPRHPGGQGDTSAVSVSPLLPSSPCNGSVTQRLKARGWQEVSGDMSSLGVEQEHTMCTHTSPSPAIL